MEAEDIKKTWQEYTELYKKDLHDPDNHDAVITHLEPDFLECEVKWALGAFISILLFLKDIVIGFNILSWWVFPSNTLNIVSHYLLISFVFDEISAISVGFFLYM